MREDIKERWLTALRSGEYEQGTSRLRTSDSFCCLGVLCDLAVQDGVVESRVRSSVDGVLYYYGDQQTVGVLPQEVQQWADLETSPNVIGDDGSPVELYELNDVFLWDFPRIADKIEASL